MERKLNQLMPPTDKYVATAQFHVRYAETDAQGVVHHASYIVWLEEARSHFARTAAVSYAEFEKLGYFMSVIGVDIRYRAALRYDELVAVDCWVEELKSRTVKFAYEVRQVSTGVICATATSEHICITREGRIAAWPADWKRWLGGDIPTQSS
jgi:acyl-CoA thioester hydrolase